MTVRVSLTWNLRTSLYHKTWENSCTNKSTLRWRPLSSHLSMSTSRSLSGLTIDSCTMPPLPAQQSMSKPDGKLVPIVQKQCGRLMTDGQGVRRRQRWAVVWEIFFFSIETSPALRSHIDWTRGNWESLFGPPGAHPFNTHPPSSICSVRHMYLWFLYQHVGGKTVETRSTASFLYRLLIICPRLRSSS